MHSSGYPLSEHTSTNGTCSKITFRALIVRKETSKFCKQARWKQPGRIVLFHSQHMTLHETHLPPLIHPAFHLCYDRDEFRFSHQISIRTSLPMAPDGCTASEMLDPGAEATNNYSRQSLVHHRMCILIVLKRLTYLSSTTDASTTASVLLTSASRHSYRFRRRVNEYHQVVIT